MSKLKLRGASFKGVFKRLFRDLPGKIFTLALALLLWFYVRNAEMTTRTFSVPLEFRDLGEGFTVERVSSPNVSIVVQGSKEVISSLSPSQFRAYVKVRRRSVVGENITAKVRIEKKYVPSSLRVVKVSPKRVSFRIAPLVSKVVEVAPTVVGEPAPGFAKSQVVVEPNKVKIWGPMDRVSKVTVVPTEPINIDGSTSNIVQKVPLSPPRGVKVHPEKVEVTVVIMPEELTRTFEALPVIVNPPPVNLKYDFEPKTIDIIVSASPEILNLIKPEDIRVTLDLSTIVKAGDYSLPASVELPEGCKLVDAIPREFKVRVWR